MPSLSLRDCFVKQNRFWSWMLYGAYRHLLTSVLFMLYIHFCHCKQLSHQEYVGYVYKAVLAQIHTWDFVQSVPLLADQEATPTGPVAVPPQHFREFLPSTPVGQEPPSLAWPLSWPWIPAVSCLRVWVGYSPGPWCGLKAPCKGKHPEQKV